jgi:hypothetical protein
VATSLLCMNCILASRGADQPDTGMDRNAGAAVAATEAFKELHSNAATRTTKKPVAVLCIGLDYFHVNVKHSRRCRASLINCRPRRSSWPVRRDCPTMAASRCRHVCFLWRHGAVRRYHAANPDLTPSRLPAVAPRPDHRLWRKCGRKSRLITLD